MHLLSCCMSKWRMSQIKIKTLKENLVRLWKPIPTPPTKYPKPELLSTVPLNCVFFPQRRRCTSSHMTDIKEIFKCTSRRHWNTNMTHSAEETTQIGIHPKTYTSLGFIFCSCSILQWCQQPLLHDNQQWHSCSLELERANSNVSEESFKIIH